MLGHFDPASRQPKWPVIYCTTGFWISKWVMLVKFSKTSTTIGIQQLNISVMSFWLNDLIQSCTFGERSSGSDGWIFRVAPQGLESDPLVGWILGLYKKIYSLCLVRSQVSSPVYHHPAWTIVEWAVVADPLVMWCQGLRVFLSRTCWFYDFLTISRLCTP
jgi:hypothetical protein